MFLDAYILNAVYTMLQNICFHYKNSKIMRLLKKSKIITEKLGNCTIYKFVK